MTDTANPPVHFDPTTHTYTLGGHQLPSVTQILSSLNDYSMVNPDLLQSAADRGTDVHQITADHDAGHDYQLPTDDPSAPYVRAWKRFIADSGFITELAECLVVSRRYHYAGTADRVGLLNSRRWLLDLKTTSRMMPSVGAQLAAYRQAWNEMEENRGQRVISIGAVQLRRDGSYQFHTYRYSDGWQEFLTQLTRLRDAREDHP